jgi:hypothetical protein
MHAGRQTNNEQACLRGTEWRHRTRVIFRPLAANLAQMMGEPRAGCAIRIECCHRRSAGWRMENIFYFKSNLLLIDK